MLFVGAVPEDECSTPCTLKSCSNNHFLQSFVCQINPETEDIQHLQYAERGIQTSLLFICMIAYRTYTHTEIYKEDIYTFTHVYLCM